MHKLRTQNIKSRSRGFTLVEILVVVTIISISVGFMVINISFGGNEKVVEEEIIRLQQLLNFAHEQSVIRSREYGIRFYETGYRFFVLNEEKDTWEDLTKDKLLRSRSLPEPLELELYIEETQVELLASRDEEPEPEAKDGEEEEEEKNKLASAASGLQLANQAPEDIDADTIKPQVFILSGSELTPPFQVRIRVPGSEIEQTLEGLTQGEFKRLEAQ